jgi:hypothetical protein
LARLFRLLIALCLLVAMWFASGIVMMYAGGMPRLDPDLRLARMPDLDLSKVRVTLADAAEKLDIDASAGWDGTAGRGGSRIQLLTVMDRPAYRFGGEGTVFADTGEVLGGIDEAKAQRIAARLLNLDDGKVRFERKLTEVDQWTLAQRRQLPLYKFTADDGLSTELYVQPQTGEVSQLTTGKARTLAWLGVISALALFQRAADQPAALVSNHGLDVRTGMSHRGAGPDSRICAVAADAAIRAQEGDPLCRLDAMALRHGRGVRRHCTYLCL